MGFSAERVEALRDAGVDARWTTLYGDLRVETPVSIAHLTASGRCAIGAFSYLSDRAEIADTTIGRFCSIAGGVLINPGNHPSHYLTTHPMAIDATGAAANLDMFRDRVESVAKTARARPVRRGKSPRTVIGSDVWICARAIVTQGVTIGHGAIVGAGAVVTKDVPPYAIVAGAPARIVRWRFDALMRRRLLKSRWWELELSQVADRDFSRPDELLRQIQRGAPEPLRVETYLIDRDGDHWPVDPAQSATWIEAVLDEPGRTASADMPRPGAMRA